MSERKKKAASGRRRPSGINKEQARFAQVRTPTGREFKVPVAKDAATLFCLEENGDWPARGSTMLFQSTPAKSRRVRV